LPGQHLLEAALAPPGNKLAAIVRQDLPRRAKVTDSALHYLEHCVSFLLSEEAVANDIPGVVVNDSHQVDRVHPLELKGEDIDLP